MTKYCNLDILSEDTDIVQWWIKKRSEFPNLFLMAMDILAIPGTAVPSERTNSEGRELLPYTRNRMSPHTIEACLVLRSSLRSRKRTALSQEKQNLLGIDPEGDDFYH